MSLNFNRNFTSFLSISSISELRNSYGSGHGKEAKYQGLNERHAKLAVGCTVTLVNFLWETYSLQKEEEEEF